MMRPSRSEPTTTLLPTKSEILAPHIRRERMSRPSSSVPHQCCVDGVRKRFGRSMCAGSCGAIQGAKMADNRKMETKTTPIAASGLWRATRGSEIAMVDIRATWLRLYMKCLPGATSRLLFRRSNRCAIQKRCARRRTLCEFASSYHISSWSLR